MTDPLMDRAFEEIDKVADRTYELSKIVYDLSTISKWLSRIVLTLVMAVLLGAGAMVFDHLKESKKGKDNQAVLEEVLKTTLDAYFKKLGGSKDGK